MGVLFQTLSRIKSALYTNLEPRLRGHAAPQQRLLAIAPPATGAILGKQLRMSLKDKVATALSAVADPDGGNVMSSGRVAGPRAEVPAACSSIAHFRNIIDRKTSSSTLKD
jgi:hypothetical protein